jgi:RNA 2',3'-cyclic 3'-phosphodiesterase
LTAVENTNERPLNLDGYEQTPAGNDHFYFALWPDRVTRQKIAAAAEGVLDSNGLRGSRTKPERYHLTLSYLGEYARFSERLVSAFCAAAEQVDTARFDILLDRAGSFSNREIPCWLGPSMPPVALRHLHDQLSTSLFKAGICVHRQRNLVPHVTILREASAALVRTPIAPISWSVGEFVLIHNHLGASPKYTALHSWSLRKVRSEPA